MSENPENNYPTFLVKRVYENEDFNEVSSFILIKKLIIYVFFICFSIRNLKSTVQNVRN